MRPPVFASGLNGVGILRGVNGHVLGQGDYGCRYGVKVDICLVCRRSSKGAITRKA